MKFSPAVTIFLSLAMSFCMPSISFGQNSRFSIGPSASVDHYRAGSNTAEWQRIKNRTKYSAGIVMYAKLSEKFILKSSILYSQRGNTVIYNADHPFFMEYYPVRKIEDRRGYLSVPVLVGYKVLESGKWSLVPAAGIYSGFMLNYFTRITYADKSERVYNSVSESNIGRLYFIYALEIGVHYQATDNVQLGISPYCHSGGISIRNYQRPECLGVIFDLRFGL